ncbi:MAG: tRNA pseudouridine(13) synthase TruD [Halobacteriota archaeon]
MAIAPPRVPVLDETVGMRTYFTRAPGIGGHIRQRVSDFRVNERYSDSEHAAAEGPAEGRYQLVKVTKTNVETHHAVRDLSRRLGISQRRISWAGTKDKRAVTTQRMSLDEVALEEPLSFHNVVVEPIGRATGPVSLGDLRGNAFVIVIRAIEGPQGRIEEALTDVLTDIHDAGGVPNFFGIQRFGSIRPVNHLVGRALVEGDIERAAMTYIAQPFPDEQPEVQEARQLVGTTYDFKEGLKRMPVRLRYERAMMNHLIKCPNDFDGAFDALSLNLQRLFVHAFQSYLFNRALSSRIEHGCPLDAAVDGDRVYVPEQGRVRTVVPKNLEEMNARLAARAASVQMAVPGYDAALTDGVIGRIEHDVLVSEGVDLEAFRMPHCPRLASRGVMRDVLLPADPHVAVTPDECNEGYDKVTLTFSLAKGGYATTVLREIMKTRVL